jgi:carboxymethylenebutenolidase
MGDFIEFDSEGGKTRAYLSLPAEGNGPGVLLLHAWWGLNDFFTGLADRLAAEGFVVLAPDLFNGRTTSDKVEAEQMVSEVDAQPEAAVQKESAALDYLLAHPRVRGDKAGAVAFSMGADYANWLSMLRPELAGLVLFYGGGNWQPDGFYQRTRAALLGHFASDDEFQPTDDVRTLESDLRDAGKEATVYIYPGTGHWFFEENLPEVYNPEAAALAWERTVDFLKSHLTTS